MFCLTTVEGFLLSLFGAIAALTEIAQEFAPDGGRVNLKFASDVSFGKTSFAKGINLVSLVLSKLLVGQHRCSFDLAIGEARMLQQPTQLSPISKLHFVVESKCR